MLLWLKIALKESSFLFRDKKYIYFAWLATLYGSNKRHTETKMSIEGKSFIVPDSLSVVWQYYEIFFKKYYSFHSETAKPRIIDIGSNIGLSIYYFNQQYPLAYISGFEADPKIYSYLKKNITSNISSPIELINKAVWINNDGIQLSQQGADGGSIMTKSTSSIHVASISLQEILEQEESVDMIKMDIEGAEIDVLLHAKKQLYKVKNMFIEFHSFKGSKQRLAELIQILEENNFRYSILDTQNFPDAAVGEIDLQCNIFCKRI